MCGWWLLNYNLLGSHMKLLDCTTAGQTCAGMGHFFLKTLDVSAPRENGSLSLGKVLAASPDRRWRRHRKRGHRQSMAIPGCGPQCQTGYLHRRQHRNVKNAANETVASQKDTKSKFSIHRGMNQTIFY